MNENAHRYGHEEKNSLRCPAGCLNISPVLAVDAELGLEGPTIAGYEAVAEAYMARHPDVVIEQMPIPLRVWPMWVRSQLTGGTIPDLVM